MVYPRAFSGKPTCLTLRRMVGPMLDLVENHSLPRTAAFFDLDKTVIAKSSTLTFSKSFYQGGLINRRAVLRTAYAQFVFLAGGTVILYRYLSRRRRMIEEKPLTADEHQRADEILRSV